MLERSVIPAPYFFRDLAEGIQQQMFFWGQDVCHPSGNFLVRQGFERLASEGAKGTSRYRMPWMGGEVELYGACAGWYGEGSGFVFIRPMKRCVVWRSSEVRPIPGAWQRELIARPLKRDELYEMAKPFLDWMISYEKELVGCLGEEHRMANFAKYDKVPKARVWLEPKRAREWFGCFRTTPELLVRPRMMAKSI